MDSPKVTVVIPVYKQAHWLPDAIVSAQNQTVHCHIIVVNDGSPDNASRIAKMYGVEVIDKENGGLSSARNTGIKAAKTEWVLTLDADDRLHPTFLEKCLQKAEETGCDIVGTWQQEFGDRNGMYRFIDNPTFEMFMESNRINCCSLYRKKMWEDVGGYDETLKRGLEDWNLWLKATRKGYTVRVVPEALFFYRKHGVSMISHVAANEKEITDEMKNAFYKYEKTLQ